MCNGNYDHLGLKDNTVQQLYLMLQDQSCFEATQPPALGLSNHSEKTDMLSTKISDQCCFNWNHTLSWNADLGILQKGGG